MKNKLAYIFILALCTMFLAGCDDDDREQSIYTSVDLSTNSLSMVATDDADVQIETAGEGYEVSSSDPAIAIARLRGNTISIQGLKAGRALITLKGTGYKRAKIDVIVAALSELTLDKATLDVNLGALGEPGSGEAEIKTGNGDYTVQTSDAQIATASIDGNKVLIDGSTEGEATITVTDRKGKTANLKVVVIGPSYDLIVDSNSLELEKGDPAATINITSGNGGYSVVSSDDNIATALLSGNKILINSVKDGYATITLSDAKGRSLIISVTVPFDLNDNTERIYWDGYRADAVSDANTSGSFTWGSTKTYTWKKDAAGTKTIKAAHTGTIQNPTLPKLTDENNITIQLDGFKAEKVDPTYVSGEPSINSVFWITFEKEGKKGFMVVKKK